jgi:translation initiation factor IF-3
VMPPFDALKIAREQGLDLVEVAPQANPPVCRIINYGKYLYQLSKRQHEARKHQKAAGLKEVKMRPRISVHDYETKRNRIIEFLKDGAKVKAAIMFRGRENAHRDLGWEMMKRLADDLSEIGQLEVGPRQEGPNLSAIFSPKKPAAKPSKPGKPAAQSAGARAQQSQEQPKAAPVHETSGG